MVFYPQEKHLYSYLDRLRSFHNTGEPRLNPEKTEYEGVLRAPFRGGFASTVWVYYYPSSLNDSNIFNALHSYTVKLSKQRMLFTIAAIFAFCWYFFG